MRNGKDARQQLDKYFLWRMGKIQISILTERKKLGKGDADKQY